MPPEPRWAWSDYCGSAGATSARGDGIKRRSRHRQLLARTERCPAQRSVRAVRSVCAVRVVRVICGPTHARKIACESFSGNGWRIRIPLVACALRMRVRWPGSVEGQLFGARPRVLLALGEREPVQSSTERAPEAVGRTPQRRIAQARSERARRRPLLPRSPQLAAGVRCGRA